MRYPPEHKEQTRARIVRAASRRFRSRGTDGAAIADLMRDLRLTHGGFYCHFASKESLVLQAFEQALHDSAERMIAAAEGAPCGRELEAIVQFYLDPDTCEDAADGCPMAALGAELARRPRPRRGGYLEALGRHTKRLAAFMPGATDEERLRQARLLFSGMPGTLTVARLIADVTLRRRFLDDAIRFYVDAVRFNNR